MFLGHQQAGLVGGFDAEEHPPKAAGHHPLHHGRICRQIDRGFRGERKGEMVLRLPLEQGRQ